ncbi:T9SS type A sorting domain-containing protein [Empedobacter brevis]|uniref:T9SS type A sorting domain-containing protein n=1 Tax=Empedobacter brevis TaxID=247 RepID=UPI00289DAE13|nr:T9SS type A sorting domain-containing protein [Empedobacter brevis]
MRKTLLSAFSLFYALTIYAQQDVLWEKSIGGKHSEYLYNTISTPDYGFLLLGSSLSDATGDKKLQNRGGLDFFIWKINEDGKQEWQQSFGGNGNDFLTSGDLTKDGGYILGGYTDSSKSGDKTDDNIGLTDYWILKLDAIGSIQWQKTIGGLGYDELVTIIQTQDGGYLLGGNSDSPKSNIKTEKNIGGKDYWIVKLNSKGNIEWDRTLGGENTDELKSIIETKESYILLGQTNSINENNQFKDFDIEAIQLNKNGEVAKKLRFGENNEDLFSSVYFDTEKQEFHLSGIFNKGDKTELTIIRLDDNLNFQSEISRELNQNQTINSLILTKEKEYLLAGSKLEYSINNNIQQQISSYQTMTLSLSGENIWSKELKNSGFDYLQIALQTRDGSIMLIGNSDSKTSHNKKSEGQGQQDFWIVKLGNKETLNNQDRKYIEAYPNPTSDYVNILINQEFKQANGAIYNLTGQLLQEFDIKYRTTPLNINNYPSGVYIIKLHIDQQQQDIKIIKK